MGKIVLGLAAPHNPNITSEPEKMTDPIKEKVHGAFDRLQKSLNEASPDCLLVLTSDHVTNFFYNNAPNVLPCRLRYLHRAGPEGDPALGSPPLDAQGRYDHGQGTSKLWDRKRHRLFFLSGNDSGSCLHGALEFRHPAHGFADRTLSHQ